MMSALINAIVYFCLANSGCQQYQIQVDKSVCASYNKIGESHGVVQGQPVRFGVNCKK